MTKRLTKLVAVVLMLTMVCGAFAACTPKDDPSWHLTSKTYNSITTVMPSNWNEFTYADNNDTQIMSYIGSSLFDFDYKFENDEKYKDGKVNADAIVSGGYTTNYSAAKKLEDVTSTVDAKWGYTEAQKELGGYAWKITLRDDLKWHDGTPITAADFEYSMKEMLNPDFMNMRANTYYDRVIIKGANEYFHQNQEGTYATVGSKGYANNQAAIDAGEVVYIDAHNFWGAKGYVDAEGNECPQWIPVTDETVYSIDGSGTAAADAFSAKALFTTYASYLEVGAGYAKYVGIYEVNTIREWDWENVGIYALEDENAVVVCLDVSYKLVNEDGSLTYHAAYEFSSLPLVKKDLYEKCKQEPVKGSTLWTSNYNSSLDTTASWGPYMLVQFEAGSHFKLAKNPNWYGWNMEQYNQDQYEIEFIYTRKVEEPSTQWMGFLKGMYDEGALTTDNYNEYKDSKYILNAPESGTYGMQLFSDLTVLKNSENNNGILAILEFRQAFNLALNRKDVIEKIWPGTAIPCFGLMSDQYYYDIENAPTLADGGSYRNSTIAKEGILRAYGYEQGEDGLWDCGEDIVDYTLDEAYATLTGYNPVLAKEKLEEAIEILTANAEYYGYDASKPVTLVYGSSVDNAKQRFRAEYIQGLLNDLSKGTALEGKITVKFDASAGDGWADAFRGGDTQIGFGYGFSGNPFDPFDIVGSFVNPDDDLNYHAYWDTSAISMTLTLPEGDYAGAGQTHTMSVQNWYYCLNGLAAKYEQPVQYNWGSSGAPKNARLVILSALEELTIKESRSVMLITGSGGSFLGAKFTNLSNEYNTFMGFGGIRYMRVNYNDGEWNKFVYDNGNDLSTVYKMSE